MNFDYYLFQQINNFAGRWRFLDGLGVFFAEYFQYLIMAGLLTFWFLGKTNEEKKKNRVMVVMALASAFVARYIFTDLIRFFYFRPRPFLAHQAFQLINHNPTGSFPSGHAAFFFALTMVVYEYNKKAGHWFLFGAFLLSLARIFAGVHYPLDILAGAIVGIFTGWLIKIIFAIIKKPDFD